MSATPSRAGLGGLGHLAARFRWSLRPPPVDADDEAMLVTALSPAELDLYRQLRPVDRAHAVANATQVRRAGFDDPVVVAAALHDVGKLAAGLGTPGRVVASAMMLLIGRERLAALGDSRLLGRLGRYADHPRRGAAMLEAAGANELAVAWAASHHGGQVGVGIDPEVLAMLDEADRRSVSA